MGNVKKGSKEQIYTPNKLTNYLLDLLDEYKGNIEISEFLEPCAGNGHMVDVIEERYKDIPIIKYDIEPKRDDIIKADFLKEKELKYKKGRVSIINPPFSKGIKFIEKCYELGDVVVSIAGISAFLNINYEQMNCENITLIKNQEFLNNEKKYNISIFVMKKKSEL